MIPGRVRCGSEEGDSWWGVRRSGVLWRAGGGNELGDAAWWNAMTWREDIDESIMHAIVTATAVVLAVAMALDAIVWSVMAR